MPNDLSNAFHADLDAIWADIQAFIATAEADLEALAQTFISNVPAILQATAKAAVSAALAAPLTGGVGAIAAAAGSAALSVLQTQGQALGQTEILQLQALVNAHVVNASTGPAVAGAATGPTASGS
jgi:hypothetical protein